MAYKKRSDRKRAQGGKAEGPEYQYNAQGSPEEKSEHAKDDGFKRGGGMKAAHKEHAEGGKAKAHLGKRARGGRAVHHGHGMARGGSPMSSGHKTTPPTGEHDGPGEQAPSVD